MKQHLMATAAIVALGVAGTIVPGFSETVVPIQGPGAKPGYPGWYLQGTSADPEGPLTMDILVGKGELGNSTRVRLSQGKQPLPRQGFGSGVAKGNNPPACVKSPICGFDGSILGGVTDGIERVVWKPTMGYTFSYPIELPPDGGNVGAASVDSHDNVWVWQRNEGDVPALFKFGPDNKLIFAVDPKLTDHTAPFRAHDMKVDPDDNVWTVNQSGSVVMKFSPEGKLLQTIGIKGKRGDWDESKGQRLLWEPVAIDFGPTGDVYIFCSHGDESPNDFASGDPTNELGVARVIHLDKTGKFINQWFGPDHGPGKFYNAHGSAVDPVTGDVWVGDRQDYRIQIFTANGHFLRTIAMRNLTSAMFFDKRKGPTFGQLWMADGQDGQVLKLDRDGNVMGAIGTRKSITPNHFSEAAFMGINSKGVFYVGDSQVPRVTVLTPPAHR